MRALLTSFVFLIIMPSTSQSAESLNDLLKEAMKAPMVLISDGTARKDRMAEGKIVSVGTDVFCAELQIAAPEFGGVKLDAPPQVRCYALSNLRWIVSPTEKINRASLRVAEF